ncbi:hypothetical protein JTE90_016157 [Oedothorax gibbosus]|uniref:Metalloendopeptidase n=1 Tax=Oedothorax gibbosus TaxID=931172 RepID=A0AAV6UTE0_9ARAC|nr:hypothetical protein JTE90_016157 [Oedothorax gibbosus]
MELLFLFLAIGFACGYPSPKIPDNLSPNIFQYIIEKTEEYLNHLKPLESPYLYHGDILLPRKETERVALANVSILWPDGVIPYVVEGLDTLKDGIKTAMKHIMDKTCIKFVQWDGKKKDYVKIKSGNECSSYVGRIGGSQRIYLAPNGCHPLGTIIHELIHTIGFDHEQNRSDRDDYLTIFWQNIWPDALDQFDKLKPSENRLINKFDFDSIMLYGERTFSKDGWGRSMKAKKKGIKIKDVMAKGKLSDSDVYRINTLYECDKKNKH